MYTGMRLLQTIWEIPQASQNLFWILRISEKFIARNHSHALTKGEKQSLRKKQQESIWNGQDVKLWESLSCYAAMRDRTLCRCASGFLLHFCFMITLCLINSRFVFMPHSVLKDSTDQLLFASTFEPNKTLSRVSQISVDHVESQKFPLVTCNFYGKFTCIRAHGLGFPWHYFLRPILVLIISRNIFVISIYGLTSSSYIEYKLKYL